MTPAAWESAIKAMERKLARMKAAARGDLPTLKVWVEGYSVRAYKIRGHWRETIVSGRKVRK